MTVNHTRGILFAMIAVLAGLLGPAATETKAAPARSNKSTLAITNFENGETLRYPVALLQGTLRDKNETTITIVNRSAKTEAGRKWTGIAHLGRFKALVELQPGKNQLLLSAGKAKLPWVLNYEPQTNPYIVRMVYVTDNSGKTDYQTPVPGDTQDFRGKFDTALKLMQCFTAEEMNAHGYGRRTFNLEFDENGRVITHVVKAARSAEEYWKETDDGKWYDAAAEAISKQIPNPTAKDLAVMAYTSFDPATKRNRAHLALGGGNLATFGGSTIYTWPNSIADVQRACMDATMTDTNQFASDSIGRNSYWANTSTCTGACLHELGHAFGLPHSADYNGIMVRGIDNFTRNFVFFDPPSASNAQPIEFKDSDIGHWETVSLAAMAPTRHFALDKRTWSDRNTISVELDAKAGSVIVESDDGLRFVGLDGPGRADVFVPIDFNRPAPRRIAVSLLTIAQRVASPEAYLRIVDAQGNTRDMPVCDAAKTFVRQWRFSPITNPWPNANAFAPVNDARLAQITEAALQTKPVVSRDNAVDFLPNFPADKRTNVAGYAVCVLRTPTPRKIKILTGSDDALRLWLNGNLLREVPGMRSCQADAETTEVTLSRGKNILLAEVSQAGGGWSLALRLEDEQGKPIRVTSDGALETVDCRALETLLGGPFVRTWHFSDVTLPWSGPPRFAAVDAAKLDEIVDSALKNDPATAKENVVDFASRFPADKQRNVAGYVVRKLVSGKARKVRLLSGSDDALRIWLNGQVVQAVATSRDAKADSDQCLAQLPKGESILVAEVSQGDGDWGLILRLQDADGRDLAVADNGQVVEWPNADVRGKPVGQGKPGK